jgi:hypothetical protein
MIGVEWEGQGRRRETEQGLRRGTKRIKSESASHIYSRSSRARLAREGGSRLTDKDPDGSSKDRDDRNLSSSASRSRHTNEALPVDSASGSSSAGRSIRTWWGRSFASFDIQGNAIRRRLGQNGKPSR